MEGKEAAVVEHLVGVGHRSGVGNRRAKMEGLALRSAHRDFRVICEGPDGVKGEAGAVVEAGGVDERGFRVYEPTVGEAIIGEL